MVAETSFEDSEARIERVLQRQERRFAEAFRKTIRQARNSVPLDTLARLLEAGDFEAASARVLSAAEILGSTYAASVTDAAQQAAMFLSTQLDATVTFDQVNSRAIQSMQINRLRLIRQFSDEQRSVLRRSLTRSIRQGLGPRDQARAFRSSIGLTNYQDSIVDNYRRQLSGERIDSAVLRRALRDQRSDNKLKKLIREGRRLTPAEIDSLVERYEQRWIKYRSEVIGRTEGLGATHEGTEEMYRQLEERGEFNQGELIRVWRSAEDARVRPSHANLNGQERQFGQVWQGFDSALRFPGDPKAAASERIQCRCIVITRFKVDE